MNGVVYLLDQAGVAIQQLTAEVARLGAVIAERDAQIAKLTGQHGQSVAPDASKKTTQPEEEA